MYYFSSSDGNDGNAGASPSEPFATIHQANSLTLNPGDQLLFKCGDVWRGEAIHVQQSGTQNAPIRYGSYPTPDCPDKPILSGSLPISGWVTHTAGIYMADLNEGANAGSFPDGLNQLFRNDLRLPMGRFPNINAPDGGYASVDSQPNPNQLQDGDLADADWSGGVLHLKGMRWYILNREILTDTADTITLNANVHCYGGCADWGYFINSHLATLDQEGEWYYDQAANRVYLYTETGMPADASIEGSVVLYDDPPYFGAFVIGRHLWEHVNHIVIDNFEIKNWFGSGIAMPRNLEADENRFLTIRNNTIHDVDSAGISFRTWVWDAANHGNGANGWRGGQFIEISDNIIERANQYGIDLYSRDALIADNQISGIGLIANLGRDGLGCGFLNGEGLCTEPGAGVRLKLDLPDYTAHNVVFRHNRLANIGANGFDIFGPHNTLEYNVIDNACISKGDCAGIRTFGRDNLTATNLHDVAIRGNIIRDIPGNTDGAAPAYRPLYGNGIYVDHFSRDILTEDNTIINATIDGILYQDATGIVRDNTVYNASSGSLKRGQIQLRHDPTLVEMTGNTLYAIAGNARTLYAKTENNATFANDNRYFHPSVAAHIYLELIFTDHTLAQWQTLSGQDSHSTESWYTAPPGADQSHIFVNDAKVEQTISLGTTRYLDLDQNPVEGSVALPPFSSIILIENGFLNLPHAIYLPMTTR